MRVILYLGKKSVFGVFVVRGAIGRQVANEKNYQYVRTTGEISQRISTPDINTRCES